MSNQYYPAGQYDQPPFPGSVPSYASPPPPGPVHQEPDITPLVSAGTSETDDSDIMSLSSWLGWSALLAITGGVIAVAMSNKKQHELLAQDIGTLISADQAHDERDGMLANQLATYAYSNDQRINAIGVELDMQGHQLDDLGGRHYSTAMHGYGQRIGVLENDLFMPARSPSLGYATTMYQPQPSLPEIVQAEVASQIATQLMAPVTLPSAQVTARYAARPSMQARTSRRPTLPYQPISLGAASMPMAPTVMMPTAMFSAAPTAVMSGVPTRRIPGGG